jgi:hypothetical protein
MGPVYRAATLNQRYDLLDAALAVEELFSSFKILLELPDLFGKLRGSLAVFRGADICRCVLRADIYTAADRNWSCWPVCYADLLIVVEIRGVSDSIRPSRRLYQGEGWTSGFGLSRIC